MRFDAIVQTQSELASGIMPSREVVVVVIAEQTSCDRPDVPMLLQHGRFDGLFCYDLFSILAVAVGWPGANLFSPLLPLLRAIPDFGGALLNGVCHRGGAVNC